MDGNRITIIIPVYNTPCKDLERLINSINGQTINEYEIIFVDDGSEKDCADYLDMLEKNNRNYVVIHKEHAGVSAASN